MIDIFYVDGVCIFGFIYFGYNDFVDLLCLFFDGDFKIYEVEEEYGGFLVLGIVVIDWFNRLGVIIDVL